MSDNVATFKRESIAVGSVVELRSGGAPMTVIARDATHTTVIWHDSEGSLNEARLLTAAIQVREK